MLRKSDIALSPAVADLILVRPQNVPSLTHIGFDDVTQRDLFCVASPTFEALPSSLSLPSEHFAVLLVADTSRADVATLLQFSEQLVAAGSVYFSSWGPGCERAHDVFDEARDEIFNEPRDADAPVIMTTWHNDESLDEALWFFLRNTNPHDAYSETCRSALAITVGSTEWAARVETRLLDIDLLTDDVLAEA